MKYLRNLLYYLVPLWGVFVAFFYFSTHKDTFFTVYNKTLGHPMPDIQVFFVVNLLILPLLLFSFIWIGKRLRQSWMVQWNALHFFTFFIVSVLLVFSIRFYWDDFYSYQGDSLIADSNGTLSINDGSIPSDEVTFHLNSGALVVRPSVTLRQYYPTIAPYLETISFPLALLNASLRLFVPFALVLVFLFSAFSLGFRPLQLFHKKDPKPDAILYSIGIGTILLSSALFLLAQLSWLTTLPVTALLVAPLLFGATPLTFLHSLTKKYTVPIQKISPLSLLLVTFIYLISSWNFIEMANLIPVGFDDFHLYLNLANLLAQHGSFIDGHYFFYPFALIQSIGPMLLGSIQFSKLIVYAFGLLTLPVFYALFKHFSSQKLSLTAILVFLSLPTIFAHFHIQVKIELPILFFGTLSIFAISQWLNDRSQRSYLWLSALLGGFAFTIKISSAILLVTLFFVLVSALFKRWGTLFALLLSFASYAFYKGTFPINSISLAVMGITSLFFIFMIAKEDRPFKEKILPKLVTLLLFFAFLALPSIPWWTNSFLTAPHISRDILLKTLSQEETDYNLSLITGQNQTSCKSLGTNASDFDRYKVKHKSGLISFLALPWDFTMSVSAVTILSDVGFLFLAFFPILLIYPGYRVLKKKDQPTADLLMLTGFLYWLLWAFIALGVIWYGISGFILLFFLFLISLRLLFEGPPFTRYLTTILLITWFIASFFLRANMFFGRTYYLAPYFSGLISLDDYIGYSYGDYPTFAKALPPNSRLFLTTQVNFRYFIPFNDRRVYLDNYLETINCLFVERDPELLFQRLRDAGFDYLGLSVPQAQDLTFSDEYFNLQKDLWKAAALLEMTSLRSTATTLFKL